MFLRVRTDRRRVIVISIFAYVTHILYLIMSFDVISLRFDLSSMRGHLLHCLKNDSLFFSIPEKFENAEQTRQFQIIK